MDLLKGMNYDELDRMVPKPKIEVATAPEVGMLRDTSVAHMKDRQPLGTGEDQDGSKLEIMVTLSTDPESPETTQLAAVVRDERGTYGVVKSDGEMIKLNPLGNKFEEIYLNEAGAAFGVLHDKRRDRVTLTPEIGAAQNGKQLVATVAMFPPNPEQPK